MIKTQGTSTVITRSDPREGTFRTAEIKWPMHVPAKETVRAPTGILVQVRGGRWEGGEALLRSGTLFRWI